MVKNLPAVWATWVRSWVGKIPWRRNWQPTSVLLPGETHRQRSLVGYSPQGHTESDVTEQLARVHTHTHTHRKDLEDLTTFQCHKRDYVQRYWYQDYLGSFREESRSLRSNKGTFLRIREIESDGVLKLGKIRRDCFITRPWAPRTCVSARVLALVRT